jgi:hypothetical protein
MIDKHPFVSILFVPDLRLVTWSIVTVNQALLEIVQRVRPADFNIFVIRPSVEADQRVFASCSFSVSALA